MIARLRGKLIEQRELQITLDVNGVCYDVYVPPSIQQTITERCAPDGELEIITFHYQQLDVGRSTPILIGFLNDIEREFFERFISVSGIGPKAAVKALSLPIPMIAQAIDDGDVSLLKSMPGVGPQRAREIIAKLQGKVGKFGLMQSHQDQSHDAGVPTTAVEEEAVAVLLQLEYKRSEAVSMVRAAIERNTQIKTSEELLNEVYKQKRTQEVPAAV